MNFTARPISLHDLVSASIAGAISKTKLAEEARRQQAQHAEHSKYCEKCHEEGDGCRCDKTASASTVSTEYVEKLAGALDYLADTYSKMASTQEPGKGPGALTVTEAIDGPPVSENQGQATPQNVVPMQPGQEKVLPKEPPTAMATNYNDPPGGGAVTPQKVAEDLATANLAKVASLFGGTLEEANLARLRKLAGDAADGTDARISAGSATPPDASAAGQPGGAPAGGQPKGPTHLIGTNEAAQNYTRGQAYDNRKKDMQQWLKEPMNSATHDRTLQNAFNRTSEAGPKIANVTAAQALLAKLAEQVGDGA